jgi:hypothetical protein
MGSRTSPRSWRRVSGVILGRIFLPVQPATRSEASLSSRGSSLHFGQARHVRQTYRRNLRRAPASQLFRQPETRSPSRSLETGQYPVSRPEFSATARRQNFRPPLHLPGPLTASCAFRKGIHEFGLAAAIASET